MTTSTQVSRDPFARTTLYRLLLDRPEPCSWCGRPARFAYYLEADSLTPGSRRSNLSTVACSIGCYRDYTGQPKPRRVREELSGYALDRLALPCHDQLHLHGVLAALGELWTADYRPDTWNPSPAAQAALVWSLPGYARAIASATGDRVLCPHCEGMGEEPGAPYDLDLGVPTCFLCAGVGYALAPRARAYLAELAAVTPIPCPHELRLVR